MLRPLPTTPESLFWSAPPALDTDFTAEDPLALDYLGQQVGNWLFPGFTTRTGRAQYYVVILYGLRLVELAIQKYGYSGDDKTRTRLYERWERLWALATLEYRDGRIERGDADAMRGIRGAKREWKPGRQPVSLEYELISRQNELAGLGSYLSSLRHHRLVVDHTLQPSAAARELIADFWSEAETHDRSQLYERYVLLALDPKRPIIPRESGAVTLALTGKKTCLSVIRQPSRERTRQRLWQILFETARDPVTLPLARLLEAAGEGPHGPDELLAGMLAGTFGELGDDPRQLVDFAQAFGELAVSLLDSFDRLYEHVATDMMVDADEAARAVFSRPEASVLRRRCARLLEHPIRSKLGALAFHGRPFLALAARLASTEPMVCLEALLDYHREVQRSRRGGGTWILREGPKLTLLLLHYGGYKREAAFPDFKLGTIRSLLRDLGRLR